MHGFFAGDSPILMLTKRGENFGEEHFRPRVTSRDSHRVNSDERHYLNRGLSHPPGSDAWTCLCFLGSSSAYSKSFGDRLRPK